MTAGEEDAMTEQHFFNLHDISQGISRTLADGVDTRIFCLVSGTQSQS
jgi:hypothetical protein